MKTLKCSAYGVTLSRLLEKHKSEYKCEHKSEGKKAYRPLCHPPKNTTLPKQNTQPLPSKVQSVPKYTGMIYSA